MKNDNHPDDKQAGTSPATGLQLASERTELALIRTGFSAAAFGAGMTHLIGRGTWHDGVINAMTIMFVFAGVLSVQAGLNRIQRRRKKTLGQDFYERLEHRMLVTGICLLQVALVMVIVMTLLHVF